MHCGLQTNDASQWLQRCPGEFGWRTSRDGPSSAPLQLPSGGPDTHSSQHPRFAACLDAGMATPMAPAALSNISSLQDSCVRVLPRPNPARRPSFSSQYISVHDCSRIITKALSSLDHARKPHTIHTAASFQHLSRRINALD